VTPHPQQGLLSTTGLNLHPGRIGFTEFRNLHDADIAKETGGKIAWHVMSDWGERLVVVPAFDGKTQVPRMERSATRGAHDDIQFGFLGRGIAKGRGTAGEGHLHLTSDLASQKADRNIRDLKPTLARIVFPGPDQLLSALRRFLKSSGAWRNLERDWPLEGREFRTIRFCPAGLVWLRAGWQCDQ
jgi:hypothetical protein